MGSLRSSCSELVRALIQRDVAGSRNEKTDAGASQHDRRLGRRNLNRLAQERSPSRTHSTDAHEERLQRPEPQRRVRGHRIDPHFLLGRKVSADREPRVRVRVLHVAAGVAVDPLARVVVEEDEEDVRLKRP
jgi:hypothetical protein